MDYPSKEEYNRVYIFFRSIVSANSVVTQNVENRFIVGSVPAHIIRMKGIADKSCPQI
jgi:acetyltransferase-like isoleucine patch superfamily enzyme